jgi:hypothetical protein
MAKRILGEGDLSGIVNGEIEKGSLWYQVGVLGEPTIQNAYLCRVIDFFLQFGKNGPLKCCTHPTCQTNDGLPATYVHDAEPYVLMEVVEPPSSRKNDDISLLDSPQVNAAQDPKVGTRFLVECADLLKVEVMTHVLQNPSEIASERHIRISTRQTRSWIKKE